MISTEINNKQQSAMPLWYMYQAALAYSIAKAETNYVANN